MTIQAWGTPGSVPDDPTDVELGNPLTAGDEVGEPVDPPVDEHLIPMPRDERVPLPPAEVPAWLTDPRVALSALGRSWRQLEVSAVNGATQLPRVSAIGSLWAVRGFWRAAWAVGCWLFDGQMHPFFGDIQASDEKMALRMAQTRERRQRFRWSVLVVFATVLPVVWWLLWRSSPVLGVFAGLVVFGGLAAYGRPPAQTLLSPGVRQHVQPRLTTQNIVRAFGALGIGKVDQSIKAGDTSRWWRSPIGVVKGGYKVAMQLPPGVVADEIVEHEQRLAHALMRAEDCVVVVPKRWITPGDLDLYIFDKPMLSGNIGPGPLATAKRTSWFEPAQLGRTRIGKTHTEALRGGAWFIGGRPNFGKSSMGRIAAGHTALDPHALLRIANLKGSPDYAGLRAVCDRYINGAPETSPEVIDQTIDMLQGVLREAAERNAYLNDLVERGLAESADVTPELAAQHEKLRPMTVIVDEIHRLFDKSDNPRIEETEPLIGTLIKAVRSVAITFIGITQLAGTESIPPAVTRAARLRGCLSVLEQVSFQQIFGQAGRGMFAASGVARFPQGVVLLRSEDGAPEKVGLHYLTLRHLEAIGKRALEQRERLHLLTGEAAGEQVAQVEREDPTVLLQDLLVAIPSSAPNRSSRDQGVAWLHALEEDLAPDRAAGWLAAELKALRERAAR